MLFADIAGFTPLSATMEPDDIVRLLDGVFTAFDRLAAERGLEKIKTIGDAYMVASGLLEPSPRHAEDLAEMAIAMHQEVERLGGMQLRIGIDIGPVVAGVIGRSKFIYDLWGDTVNTASRMESHSTPGEIQITRATYELLKDEFVCEPRGTILVKGKGQMETWFLVGSRSDVPSETSERSSAAHGK